MSCLKFLVIFCSRLNVFVQIVYIRLIRQLGLFGFLTSFLGIRIYITNVSIFSQMYEAKGWFAVLNTPMMS